MSDRLSLTRGRALRRLLWAAAFAMALSACDDEAAGSVAPDQGVSLDAEVQPDEGPEPDADTPQPRQDATPPEVDAEPPAVDAEPADIDAEPAEVDAEPPPQPVHVALRLEPRRPLYAPADELQVKATISDAYGEALQWPIAYRVEPPELAQIDEAGQLTIQGEGPATIYGCVEDDSQTAVCGQVSLFSDAAPPQLEIEQPVRGAIFGADGRASITVSGTATDSRAPVDLRINGLRVQVAEAGRFQLELPARFGINHIEVIADDGVQPATRRSVDVLWAPEYLEPDAAGTSIPNALYLRIEQAMLDSGEPVVLPPEGGELHLTSFAETFAALLGLADPLDGFGDPQIIDTAALALRIEGVDMGLPQVEMGFTREGMALDLRLPNLRIATSGAFDLEGATIALDGAIEAALAAYVHLKISPDPQSGLALSVEEVYVTVESIRGDYANETASALISTLSSALGTLTRQMAEDLVTQLLVAQLPDLVTGALGDALRSLRNIPLNLSSGLAGAPPVMLNLALTPGDLEVRYQQALILPLDARVNHLEAPEAPYDDPGVPALSLSSTPPNLLGAGLTGFVRLEWINAILHAVWRSQLLQMSPALPPEAQLFLSEIHLDGHLPPVLAPAPLGSAWPFELQLGDLRVNLIGAGGGEQPDRYAISISVGVAVVSDGLALSLEMAPDPDVRGELIEAGGEQAVFSGEQLAALLEGLVWPQVQAALAGGLRVGVSDLSFDLEALSSMAPRVESFSAVPAFEDSPWLLENWLVLEGAFSADLQISAP